MSDEINEITEGHSDYKPADARDENVKHQLTGMYQNWFLDYASYVILERAADVLFFRRGAAPGWL